MDVTIITKSEFNNCFIIRAVPIDAIIGGGGCIDIFMFTYRKNNRFQKKSAGQNTNI